MPDAFSSVSILSRPVQAPEAAATSSSAALSLPAPSAAQAAVDAASLDNVVGTTSAQGTAASSVTTKCAGDPDVRLPVVRTAAGRKAALKTRALKTRRSKPQKQSSDFSIQIPRQYSIQKRQYSLRMPRPRSALDEGLEEREVPRPVPLHDISGEGGESCLLPPNRFSLTWNWCLTLYAA